MSRRTLVSFVGLRDPFYHDVHDDGPMKGPLLTVLDERRYDRVILLGRTHRQDQLDRTSAALRTLHPKLPVEVRMLHLSDSTYHPEILSELRRVLSQLRRDTPKDDYSISLLSGPAEIHACWVLLAASGEFPARLLEPEADGAQRHRRARARCGSWTGASRWRPSPRRLSACWRDAGSETTTRSSRTRR
jgi:hypothetical protein